ncbi:MAG: hypothetical protein EHM13_07030 [Acidobacteria bacterium]|nr:MAG: hypothetical protein EHM13_07030 [Acidobacteriota bacterium]
MVKKIRIVIPVLFAVLALALNAIPAVGFPAAWLSLVPIGIARAARLSFAHGVITMAAAGFGFGCILALRSLLLAAAGPRLFRRLSTVVQFVLVLALVTLFFLIPTGASRVLPALEHPSRVTLLSPALMYLGAYEQLTAPGLLGDPQLLGHGRWNLWLKTRKRLAPDSKVIDKIFSQPEEEARARYEALLPSLNRLGRQAFLVSMLVWGLAALLYFAAHARHAGRLREAMVVDARGGRFRRGLASMAGCILVRHPVTRAGFFFTLHALARSGKHRLYIAGYLAVGIALASVTAAPAFAAGAGSPNLALSLLALQMTLVFFAVAGLRAVIEVPAELRSNWVFRACWTGDLRRYLAGVRRAALTGVVLPLLALLLPAHVIAWGWTFALRHLAVDAALSLILVEAAFVGCRKLPFTCSYVPKGSLKFLWPAYLLAFLGSTYLPAYVEQRWLGNPDRVLDMVVVLGALLAAVRLYGLWLVRRSPQAVFEDLPDPAAVALGLEAN